MMRRWLPLVFALALVVPATAQASVSMCNVPITMSDGVVLRANVFLPSNSGRFPVVITATGYNKDVSNPAGQSCSTSSGLAVGNAKLLDHGIGVMLLDDRGTGASEGRWDSWGARTQEDYKDVL